MLIKIKKLDLSTVPYLTEGSRALLLTGVEARYESVAEAAVLLPPLRQRPLLLRPSRLLLSLRLRRPRQVLPSLRRRLRGVLAPLFLELLRPKRLLPLLPLLQDHLSRRRRQRAPVVPPSDLAGRLGLKAGSATFPAKSPRAARSAESPRRVTLMQDDTDDEPELISAELF